MIDQLSFFSKRDDHHAKQDLKIRQQSKKARLNIKCSVVKDHKATQSKSSSNGCRGVKVIFCLKNAHFSFQENCSNNILVTF